MKISSSGTSIVKNGVFLESFRLGWYLLFSKVCWWHYLQLIPSQNGDYHWLIARDVAEINHDEFVYTFYMLCMSAVQHIFALLFSFKSQDAKHKRGKVHMLGLTLVLQMYCFQSVKLSWHCSQQDVYLITFSDHLQIPHQSSSSSLLLFVSILYPQQVTSIPIS